MAARDLMSERALRPFDDTVTTWFRERYGRPTDIQAQAWPKIAAGEHLLITAPTGSGKMLTAFLWALNQLLTGTWEGGRVRVLYVSPLRALNNDIRRNLLEPLEQLEEAFERAGKAACPVRVETRSGDTPGPKRPRMLRHPPEILISTPETLNILLTSKGGRSLLHSLECVVLDEIHAVAASKRGTHLITAVERLTLLSGEFQRALEADQPADVRRRPTRWRYGIEPATRPAARAGSLITVAPTTSRGPPGSVPIEASPHVSRICATLRSRTAGLGRRAIGSSRRGVGAATACDGAGWGRGPGAGPAGHREPSRGAGAQGLEGATAGRQCRGRQDAWTPPGLHGFEPAAARPCDGPGVGRPGDALGRQAGRATIA